MSIHILDASALIAYVSNEAGGELVRKLIQDPEAICYAHCINLCEIYYTTIRSNGVDVAKQTIINLIIDGVIERRDMSQTFWQRVGDLKARGKISLPDCFCIALAQELGGEVVTSDHGEFDPLVSLSIVPIKFIR